MADFDTLTFPRHVHRYHPDGPAAEGAWMIVRSVSDCEAALADGWSLDCVLTAPDPACDVPPVLPKRRGRPPKGDA